MSEIQIPQGYTSLLSIYETQKAISLLKRLFEDKLAGALRLHRVSAPLFVSASSGLNDDLNGVERPVSFDINGVEDTAQVVHSLAKWKRLALKRYQFQVGEGLYTDMNAIRRDEELDHLHSAYVDQWDWEKVIRAEDRNTEYLQNTVRSIVSALADTQYFLRTVFPQLSVLPQLTNDIAFVTSQELEDLYPTLTGKERENAFVKDHPVTFLMGIGGKLRSGKPHDGRAPDYDDWNLNGDLLVWDSVNGQAIELSSMGIRVDPESLDRQLTLAGCDDRRELPFHKMLLSGQLPLTMGGGIGQSRVSMLLLGKCHIGEVQSSLWDEANVKACEKAGVILL
ncbi:aspartate--ammonia ligase [Pseudoflavonifractor phocaeensis]|uniref:aspartate--ammonia ligase n=1 Tax=Pseudoflavonifractor phocaeensis TaxID=1870988 RepID=UPI001F3892CF|nr:aspartate--ammonia ligase [Pseudoflavonifractor phocaeensis]MCF2595078.1 aspartate--ammonia ligase [Pseudoflavonifractor phocaeensis]MDY3905881.1 aspartate--ammonia ligase [Lawsonibacter sp.]